MSVNRQFAHLYPHFLLAGLLSREQWHNLLLLHIAWLTVVATAVSASQIHEPIIPVMKTIWDNSLVKLIGSFRTAARLYCTKLICLAFAFTLPDVLTPFQMLKYTMVKINNKQRVNCQLMPPRSSSPLDLCTCRTWRLKEERKTQYRYFFNKCLC